ncbi:MAG: SDR family oxidoreductase, partial [Sciscionella sp.]
MTNYLVTGATGLIGRHVVSLLLQRPDTGAVHALVREGSRDKFAAAARQWSHTEKLLPLLGDISATECGVAAEAIAELTGTIDHVVHLAALYDITADDEASTVANVEGTAHVLALAATLRAGCLQHVSSVAVAGDYHGTFTEDMFDAGQTLPTPYHRTKFESERLVRSQHEVPWRVYRPAVVVGHSQT